MVTIIDECKTSKEAEKLFFKYLHIPQKKLTYKNYMELMIFLYEKFRNITIPFDIMHYTKDKMEYFKICVLDQTLFWSTGWDWKNNHIPKRTVEYQNKIRNYFKMPELTPEQIQDYDFTNKPFN